MPKQLSPAAKIIRLCNEILSLGRKEDLVGEYKRGCGPLGGGGRSGTVLDERWKALAEQFDALAEEISLLVRAIDHNYPVEQFYQADSLPYIARVPGGRVRMPDHERESARDHMRWLHRGKTEAEIDSLLAKFVTSMENLKTARARAMYSKPQWPGAVMLETDRAGKPHLIFMSSPETVCQFEERFKAVKTWAETYLTNEAAEVPGTGGKTAKPAKVEKPINPTLQKAAAFIRRHPGSNADQIGKHCGVEGKTIRNLAPALRALGITTTRGCTGGYWPPAAAK